MSLCLCAYLPTCLLYLLATFQRISVYLPSKAESTLTGADILYFESFLYALADKIDYTSQQIFASLVGQVFVANFGSTEFKYCIGLRLSNQSFLTQCNQYFVFSLIY